MNHLLSKKRVNNQKRRLFNEKITETAAASMQNKANFRTSEIGVNSFETNIYEILSAWRGKKTNPIKPNSNPITERPKMNTNAFSKKDYDNESTFRPPKAKPIQTQNKANQIYPRMS